MSEDFNGDSHEDLAVVLKNEDKVCVLYGNGDFTFDEPFEYHTVGSSPVDIAGSRMEDPDDGNVVSLIVANRDDQTLGILYYEDAIPGFKEQRAFDLVGSPQSVEVGILDDPDNAIGVSIAGVARDPDQLFVFYYEWRFIENQYPQEQQTLYWPTGTDPADLVLVRESSEEVGSIVALTNTGDDTVMIFRELEAGGFAVPESIQTGDGPGSIDVGEFDLDGKTEDPDLVVANSAEETICLLLSDGQGGFESPRFHHIGDIPHSLVAADFNNDGWTDVGVAGQEEIAVWFNKTNCADNDDDGFQDVDCGKNDCDDEDPHVFPGAPEICDGEDNDCDGTIDGDCEDGDGDGWASCDGEVDCNDADPDICPDPVQCPDCQKTPNGIDDDCDGIVDDGDPGSPGCPQCFIGAMM